ncbi:carboxypeptidase-like regulatory domain-containing protein [Sphingobacterium paucimobilis]|uniref:TonB-dependent receptor plug domain-containing protein n=1 Tax=Sphingobacterium paucimobilis HER1398 TaxID=1346330 RepID=U2HZZ1_9SPHI|nr:carboxypeptidase-like regulatory domain-containing protein [Sphingobacterium paucimobilis]ERJ61097.1 hypothetical protein M472_20310 [Sphingobacterium paucimobilis HER1398]
MKKAASILSFLFCLVGSLFAQEQLELQGKVTDGNNGSIKNITITIKGKEETIQTNDVGSYRTTIPEGKQVVKFSAPGYASKTIIIEVVDNTQLDVQLDKIQNSKSSRL